LPAAAGEAGLPFVPGAVTPSEVGSCLEAGAKHLKFFPAGAYGGTATLAALDDPFGWTGARFMPTGGVRPENAADYLSLPNVFAIGGTWIAPRDDITAGRWDVIGERARAGRDPAPPLTGRQRASQPPSTARTWP
jgi:2-dehydro-3-deoxyphosphogluconate aldolase/(4S)-4-hydroxy-2-oxoglutarate aldolase